jgi:hypothetical protein
MSFRVRIFLALVVLVSLSLIYGRKQMQLFTKMDDCLDAGGCWLDEAMKCEFESQSRCDAERRRK